MTDDNQEWEEALWGDDAEKVWSMPEHEPNDTAHLKILKLLAGKDPQTSDMAYNGYTSLADHRLVKQAATRLVAKIGGQFNFDDALVWLATFDFDVIAMNEAISEWIKETK